MRRYNKHQEAHDIAKVIPVEAVPDYVEAVGYAIDNQIGLAMAIVRSMEIDSDLRARIMTLLEKPGPLPFVLPGF